MTPPAAPERDNSHRFPGAIMRHGGWLSARCPLSSRDVQALLGERGIDGTHEAMRPWGLQCGPDDAQPLKRRRAQPGDQWSLDEVFLPLTGKRHAWWRAGAPEDPVLALLVQSRRPKHAAQPCFRQWLTG